MALPLAIPIAMQLAHYAPQVIGWLSGSQKAEEAAQRVVGIAEQVTGLQGRAAVDAIQADPELAIAFRRSVLEHEQAMDALYLADRADARKRDVALAEAGKVNQRANLLALFAVATVIFGMWLVAQAALNDVAMNALMLIMGTMLGCVRDVYHFEFGSSRGSKEKDQMIAKGIH